MMTMLTRILSTSLASAVAMTSLPILAVAAPEESGDDDKERGLELFQNGKRLYDEGSYDAAVVAFEGAYKILDEPNLLFNIHLCYERLEKFDKAVEVLDTYRALAPADEQASLEERRSALIKRKEKMAAEEAARLAEEKAEAERDSTTQPETNDEPTEPVKSSGDGGEDRPEAPKRIFGPLAIAGTAIGVVGLGVGLGLGLANESRKSSAEDACGGQDNLCLESYDEDASSTRGLATGANVAFAVGGAGLIVAIVAISVNASRKRRATAMTPTLQTGRRAAIVGVRARF